MVSLLCIFLLCFCLKVIGSNHEYHFVHHALPHARTKRSVMQTRQLKADPLVSSRVTSYHFYFTPMLYFLSATQIRKMSGWGNGVCAWKNIIKFRYFASLQGSTARPTIYETGNGKELSKRNSKTRHVKMDAKLNDVRETQNENKFG